MQSLVITCKKVQLVLTTITEIQKMFFWSPWDQFFSGIFFFLGPLRTINARHDRLCHYN